MSKNYAKRASQMHENILGILDNFGTDTKIKYLYFEVAREINAETASSDVHIMLTPFFDPYRSSIISAINKICNNLVKTTSFKATTIQSSIVSLFKTRTLDEETEQKFIDLFITAAYIVTWGFQHSNVKYLSKKFEEIINSKMIMGIDYSIRVYYLSTSNKTKLNKRRNVLRAISLFFKYAYPWVDISGAVYMPVVLVGSLSVQEKSENDKLKYLPYAIKQLIGYHIFTNSNSTAIPGSPTGNINKDMEVLCLVSKRNINTKAIRSIVLNLVDNIDYGRLLDKLDTMNGVELCKLLSSLPTKILDKESRDYIKANKCANSNNIDILSLPNRDILLRGKIESDLIKLNLPEKLFKPRDELENICTTKRAILANSDKFFDVLDPNKTGIEELTNKVKYAARMGETILGASIFHKHDTANGARSNLNAFDYKQIKLFFDSVVEEIDARPNKIKKLFDDAKAKYDDVFARFSRAKNAVSAAEKALDESNKKYELEKDKLTMIDEERSMLDAEIQAAKTEIEDLSRKALLMGLDCLKHNALLTFGELSFAASTTGNFDNYKANLKTTLGNISIIDEDIVNLYGQVITDEIRKQLDAGKKEIEKLHNADIKTVDDANKFVPSYSGIIDAYFGTAGVSRVSLNDLQTSVNSKADNYLETRANILATSEVYKAKVAKCENFNKQHASKQIIVSAAHDNIEKSQKKLERENENKNELRKELDEVLSEYNNAKKSLKTINDSTFQAKLFFKFFVNKIEKNDIRLIPDNDLYAFVGIAFWALRNYEINNYFEKLSESYSNLSVRGDLTSELRINRKHYKYLEPYM